MFVTWITRVVGFSVPVVIFIASVGYKNEYSNVGQQWPPPSNANNVFPNLKVLANEEEGLATNWPSPVLSLFSRWWFVEIKLVKRTTIKLVYVTAMFCVETLCYNDAASKKFTVITKSQRCHAMDSSVTTQINSDKIQVSHSFRYYVSLCNKLERKIRENQNAIP